MTPLVVTGTGTGVGKTIVTAAIASAMAAAGRSVAVVKPAQTGLSTGEESDVEAVARLAGITDVHELARYPAPLAPASAARVAGILPTPVATMVEAIGRLQDRDLLVVEGAGGLLVRLDADGATIADIARGLGGSVVVVAAAGLGTLNATALTCEALAARGLHCAGVVIGAWPRQPDLAAQVNLDDLPSYAGAELLGVLPSGAGTLDPGTFRDVAIAGLAPALGGVWSR